MKLFLLYLVLLYRCFTIQYHSNVCLLKSVSRVFFFSVARDNFFLVNSYWNVKRNGMRANGEILYKRFAGGVIKTHTHTQSERDKSSTLEKL